MSQSNELLEKLAAIEHQQWMQWSQNVADAVIDEERTERWRRLWIPYDQLSEEMKEQDRTFAKAIMVLLRTEGIIQ